MKKRHGQGERETLSVEEAACLLGLGRNAAYAAARSGEIPSIRIGGRILIPRVQLAQLLEGKLPNAGVRHEVRG